MRRMGKIGKRLAYGLNKSRQPRRLQLETLESRQLLAILPVGFEETNWGAGLLFPTSMEFAPDGRLFVTEKSGAVRLIENGTLQTEPMLDLPVNQRQENGIQGIAIDPDFANNGFAYLYYTREASPLPINRLSRFQISATNNDTFDPASEDVLLDGIAGGDPGFHNGGFLDFGPDGMLYVGIGDTTRANLVQGLGNLPGKILRLNVANYPNSMIPADNPYVGVAGARPEIWASGFRNPFTGAVDPETGRIFINDVGNVTFEEINALQRGGNYGWPLKEGVANDPAFVDPLLAYEHDPILGGSITGGTFYNGEDFPAEYHHDYFFADYTQGFIKTFDQITGQVATFTNDALTPVDLDVGPDGQLYWLSLLNGTVHRISYVGGNRAPEAISNADITAGLAPLTVRFNSTGSHDPDGDAITLLWNFGDGVTSTELDPVHTFTANRSYQVLLTVSDGSRTSEALPITIFVGDLAPEISFTVPTQSQTYFAGQTFNFGATAVDRNGVPLPASAFEWSVTFYHRTHLHPYLPSIPNVQSGTFTIPTSGEADSIQFYRVRVKVTNENGISSSRFYDLQPKTSPLTLTTNFPGLALLLDEQPIQSPHSFVGVEQMVRSLTAPASQVFNGTEYVFERWSNGGNRQQDFVTPTADNLTITAIYRQIPNDAAVASTPPVEWYAGQQQTYNVSLTNLLGETWNASGPNAIRLAAYFGTSDETVGQATATLFSLPGNVLSGQTIVVPVTITAPIASGNFVLRHRMEAANGNLVRGSDADDVTISGLAATYQVIPPTQWRPGETRTYSITLTNTGTRSWPEGGATPVHLGVYFGDQRDEPYVWGINEPTRYFFNRNVDVGDSITLQIAVTAPTTPGNYVLRHRLVRENVGWFIPQEKTAVVVQTNVPPVLDVQLTGNAPTNWRVGTRQTYAVVLKNTGNVTWLQAGVNKVQLGVYFNGRSDTIYDWPSEPIRFELPRDVLPGESVTINVQLNPPQVPGAYVLRHRLVQENVQWLTPLLKKSVQVDSFSAAMTGTVPTAWRAGQLKTYAITLQNTGSLTWSMGGANPIRLGAYFTGRSDAIGDWTAEPIRIFLPRNVAAGETITLNVTLRAPQLPGTYILRHRVVEEGVQWLAPVLKAITQVDILAAAVSGTIPANWLAGQTQTYNIVLQNTGTLTWRRAGVNPIRLGVYFDGRSDAIYDWPTEPRRFLLPRDVLAGETVTVSVTLTAAQTAGNYVLRHRIVEEGVQWLQPLFKTNMQVQNLMAAATLAAGTPISQSSEMRTVQVRLVNRGKTEWQAAGANRVRLMVYFDNRAASAVQVRLPKNVAAGESVLVTMRVRVPAAKGRHLVRVMLNRAAVENTRLLAQSAFVVR